MPSDDAVDSCVELVAADDISAGRELGGCFPFNQLPGIDRVSLLGDGEVRIQELDDTSGGCGRSGWSWPAGDVITWIGNA